MTVGAKDHRSYFTSQLLSEEERVGQVFLLRQISNVVGVRRAFQA